MNINDFTGCVWEGCPGNADEIPKNPSSLTASRRTLRDDKRAAEAHLPFSRIAKGFCGWVALEHKEKYGGLFFSCFRFRPAHVVNDICEHHQLIISIPVTWWEHFTVTVLKAWLVEVNLGQLHCKIQKSFLLVEFFPNVFTLLSLGLCQESSSWTRRSGRECNCRLQSRSHSRCQWRVHRAAQWIQKLLNRNLEKLDSTWQPIAV